MLSQKYCVGLLLVTLTLMATPVNAQLKPCRVVCTDSSLGRPAEKQSPEAGLPTPYAQLQRLLGHKLYEYLLQNDEFIVLQDLVITHLEKEYPVYSSK